VEQTNEAASNSQPPTEQEGTHKEQAKQQIQDDKQQPKQEEKQEDKQQEDKKQDQAATAVAEDTSSYVVIEKKIEDIIKEFDITVGTELVEAVRTKLVCKYSSPITLYCHSVVILIMLSH